MLRNGFQYVMSHTRDVSVLHAIDKRIFITVPLYFEKGMILQNARIECGELIIEGKMPTALSNAHHQPSVPSEASHRELQ
jgi:hypothetical protein